jgi:uncharacterized repeat protein (TIGR02543 family)
VVNIIDPATGDIIASTITDANGYYQVFVPAGGPYLLQAVKDGVVVLQITPQVEVGIEYDLGIADCSTTAVALIALAMMDAGANLADINLADIAADPNFDDVLSNVTSIIEAGGDPTESAVIQQAVEDFLSPPAPAPTPPALSSAKEITSYKFEAAANAALSSDVIGSVDSGTHTVALTVPFGTDLTALVATFELSTSAAAKIGSTDQVSGTTANDFTSPVTYTVTAEDGSTQDWVVTVTVAIGPLHHFTITGYPATVIAGVAFASDVVVTAYDADNNVKTDYTGEVYFTSTDGSATLPYTLGSKYTFTAGDNGVHTFTGIGFTLKTAGSQTITLTDGTVSVGSSTITVNPADADYFKVTGTASMTAGGSNTITITAYDQYDNIAIGYIGDKTLTFSGASSSSSPVTSPTCSNKDSADINFASDTVITFTNGVGTSTMKLYKTETAHIKATQGSITTSDSNDLDVTVTDGSLNYVKVEDATGGTGSEVTTHSMTADETFTVYAAGYDAYGNYKNDESVTWIGTGECSGKLIPVSNTSGTAPVDSNNPYASGEEVMVLGKGDLVKIQDGISLSFTGWNTEANGSGTDRAAGSTFAIDPSNVTLYARWSAIRATGPAGGLIFYDRGSYTDATPTVPSWRYMEAAPSDQSTSAQWGCWGLPIPGADGTTFGTGEQNTIDIEAGCTDAGTAADICANLVLDVYYDDWFLPSKYELNQMYEKLKLHEVGGFVSGPYWSSSEDNFNSRYIAWGQGFYDGIFYYYNKNVSVRVRAARAF